MIRAREASEQMATSNTAPPNRVLALSLSDILDARKSARSSKDIGEIAQSYGLDVQTLQRVGRFVNTPSVAPNDVTRVVGKDGEEKTTMVVCLNLINYGYMSHSAPNQGIVVRTITRQ
jgi:N-glycosylase/DNA lyase